ncbi:MAG: sulfite exporter TauE/SafE family protein, partial [Hydrogenophaga sp.]
GYIFVPALVVIASVSVFMAPVGVRAAHALPVKSLRRVFAGILYLLAVYMAYKGITG